MFGGWHKILSDNGIEFKSKLSKQVASILGMKQIFSSPYYPTGNRCIKNLHNFLHICIWKHVFSELAWDEVVPIVCAAYNFVPNEHSKESAFFLTFGRDAYTPLEQLLHPNLRYVDNDKSFPALNPVQDIYALVIHNIKLSGEEQQTSFWHILPWIQCWRQCIS